MTTSLIELMNRVRSTETTDSCTLLTNLVDKHFEKFRCFHQLLHEVDLKNVSHLHSIGDADQNRLQLQVEFEKKTHAEKFSKSMHKKLDAADMMQSPYFNTDISLSGKTLNITIENKTLSGEDEMYELGIGPDSL